MTLQISPAQQDLLLGLLQKFLPHIAVWAFGSRITGKARPTSDLDLIVFAKPEEKSQVFALQEALEESNLPFAVDVLIWDDISPAFQAHIQQRYVQLHVIKPRGHNRGTACSIL